MHNDKSQGYLRKPEWLKARPGRAAVSHEIKKMLRDLKLNTVCEEAGCPNCGECFSRRTATFLILGQVCSRDCRFCQVSKGRPQAVDPDEPERLALAVSKLRLRHVVITSVTRDDLADGGADVFAEVIRSIRRRCGGESPVIEVLIPDFQGDRRALAAVAAARPEIINHNLETVPRLYPLVRPQAGYRRSLELLEQVKQLDPGIISKSGLMVGLGETEAEVLAVLKDLRLHGCDILTIGQYLAPSRQHLPVAAYIHPDIFAQYRRQAEELGFKAVASGPLVRSSYLADQVLEQMSRE